MSQLSLNNVHLHKEKTDTIDLVGVAKEFISANKRRLHFLEVLMNNFHASIFSTCDD